MKNLFKITMSLLILSGAGLAMGDEALVQTKPLVKADVNTDANVSANTNASVNLVNGKDDINASSSADVNETDKIEVNKAALRDSDVNINMARKDVIRDTDKLKEDTAKFEEAQSAKDDQVMAKAKADVDNDKEAVNKDRERLEKHLSEKINSDKVIVRKFDERIQNTRKDVVRDTHKMSDDTAKLADAQARYTADEIEKAKADIENDKTVVNADTEKLNARISAKADFVTELKNDRRHLDAVEKHLSDEDQVSVSDTSDVQSMDTVNN
jgi:hypothetical protein